MGVGAAGGYGGDVVMWWVCRVAGDEVREVVAKVRENVPPRVAFGRT